MMVFLWYGLLLSTHLLSFVQSLECDQDRQYKWPKEKSIKCCDKCKPGQYMTDRCNEGSTTMCKQCPDESYIDFYNNELRCKSCTQCPEKHMVYKENCTKKGDAKCGCESGYELDGMECKKILTTLATPSTTTKTTQQQIPSPTRDSVWISLSLCCACMCILLTCFILISRHTSACGWIMPTSTDCFWARKNSSTVSSQCTEEEEVPMPVQEACGKTHWQEEV
ncbi:CD27 antigen isoform X4 [Electrophorus electricus]|uniref:CD27 antigen isoform X4 n=1 Tax=Electrophorus electricus TaxID=8005 RepID=UPI0015D00B1A|nr:CD27 antigen isoform X4 [Electrophorus electricus]